MASLRSQLEAEHQRAEDASRAFYESEEYLNLESTNINIGREEVFDFSFLGEGVLEVIETFKTKLAEEETPLTEVLDDETQQPEEAKQEAMDEDEDRQQ